MPLFGPPNIEKLEAKRNVARLIRALKYAKSTLRKEAARALGRIGDKRAVEPLIAALKSEDPHWVREAAAEALAKIGDKRAVEPLIAALKDERSDVRAQAAKALGVMEKADIGIPIIRERAVEPLIAALKSSGGNSFVGSALAKIGDKRVVEPLIAALKDERRPVRAAAARALGRIGDKRAVEPLIAALKSEEDGYARDAVAEALASIDSTFST